MRLLLGIRISDVDCGLKLFRRDLLEGLDLQAKGAMISAELMAQLAGRGARFAKSMSVTCRAWPASNPAPASR